MRDDVMRLGRTLGAPRGARAIAVLLWATAIGLAAPSAPARAQVPADGRVWELVTAGPDNGVRLLDANGWTAGGDTVSFSSIGPLPGALSGELIATSVATRTAAGWQTRRIGTPFTSPTAQLLGERTLGASRDLSTWLWGSVNALLPDAPSSPSTGLYRIDPGNSLVLIGDLGDDGTFSGFSDPEAVSDDARHVAFSVGNALLPEDAGRVAGRAAYEFADSTLRLVGVDDGGAPLSPCGAVVGDGSGDPRRAPHPMSHDGSRIFFTSPTPGTSSSCPQPAGVYLRENGVHTVEVSGSHCTRLDCGPPTDAHFIGATPDGAYAFITTAQQLTDDDVDSGTDLYRYTTATGELVRISAGPADASANVDPTAIVFSDLGDRVYFSATGALVPDRGADGEQSLYLWDRGQLRYVGRLEQADLTKASTSADGSILLFATAAQLLPGDTDGRIDLYRCDVASNACVRVSLGSQGRGNGEFDVTTKAAGALPLPGQVPLALTADGGRAFFVTSEPLTAEDVNAQDDVYEWHDGKVGLITSGAAVKDPAIFEGVSPDGRSAFFATEESLVPDDRDQGDRDLYDARLGGGFPASATMPECDGDACQGPIAGPVGNGEPDSVATMAEGNLAVTPRRIAFALLPMSAAARRRLERTGDAVVNVRAAVAGRVTVKGTARVDRRLQLVAAGAATARAPGTVRVRLRLRAIARRHLRRRDATLRIRLMAAQPAAHVRVAAIVVLRGGAR